jgi:signal transduction histidine kinase
MGIGSTPLALFFAGLTLTIPAEPQTGELSLTAPDQGWILESYGTPEGLPQNTANDVVQTPDGYVWIATFGGLARFDGVEFEIFDLSSRPSLPDLRVTALLADSEGVLWVGTQNGFLLRYLDGAFVPVPTELERGAAGLGTVWAMAEDAAGRVWVAGSERIGTIAPDEPLRPLASPGAGAQDVATSSEGAWFVSAELGARHLSADGEVLEVVPVDGPPPASVAVGGDRVYFGSSTGVLEYDEGAVRGLEGDHDRVTGDRFGRVIALGPSIRVLHDPTGDPDAFPVFRLAHASGFPPHSATMDAEGGLWVGTGGGGIARLRRTRLTWFGARFDLDPVGAASVGVDSGDGVWTVFCEGVARLGTDRRAEVRTVIGREGCLEHLVVDREDAVWATAPDGQLLRSEGRAFVELSAPVPGPVTPFLDRQGRAGLLIHDRLFVRDGGGWDNIGRVTFAPGEELRNPPVQTRDGAFWIGTTEGLIRWTPDEVQRVGPEDGLAPGAIRSVVGEPEGDLWVGSYGGGISRIRGDEVRTLTVADGLAENSIVEMAVQDDLLWISANRSLSAIPLARLHERVDGGQEVLHPAVFGAADGFREGAGVSVVRDGSGDLWFPTLDGVIRVADVGAASNNGPRPAPTILFETVTADGVAIDPGEPVPAGVSTVTVEFAAPRFTRPENLRFRYRLLGLDERWNPLNTERRLTLNGAPPGRYTLEVEVADVENRAERTASLQLDLRPHVWESAWFRVLMSVVLVAGLAGVMQWRYSTMRSRANELQTLADRLTDEIEERARVEAEREQLQGQLLRAQKLEAVGRLTGGIAHDFNNVLTAVVGNLDLLRDEQTTDEDREVLEGALSAAERGTHLTRQLLGFSSRSELTPRRMDAVRTIQGMRALVQPAVGRDVTWSLDAPTEVWDCYADPDQLEHVVLNLLINARDAMEGGGRVTIRLANEPVRPDEAPGLQVEAGNYVRLTVEDTGHGIPEELLAKVLDPFFTTKPPEHGTGLGLSTAFGFARQSGGSLQIESHVGRGTSVHLYLPRWEAANGS